MATKEEDLLVPGDLCFGVLVNPLAGRVRGRLEKMRLLGSNLGGAGYQEATTPAEIEKALSLLLDQGAHALCIVGGDGTVQAALTALHVLVPPGEWPLIAALPGGTMNMTARDLRTWSSAEEGMEALLSRRWGGHRQGADRTITGNTPETFGKIVRRPVLRIEGAGVGSICGMFFGTGAVAPGVRYFEDRFKDGSVPGNSALWFTIARILGSLASGGKRKQGIAQPLSFSPADRPGTEHQALLCLASTLDRFLLDLRPYWGRESKPIHFTLVEHGARGFWWNLGRLARGRPNRGMKPEAGYISENAERVDLSFDGSFVVDGEFFEARASDGPLSITTVPQVGWLAPGEG